MPDHATHKAIDKAILKEEFPDVHKFMDEPIKWLGGSRHRILRHSLLEISLKYSNDPKRFTSALFHLLADNELKLLPGRKK